jgi:large subunit ribosomal protein L9
MRVIFLEDVPRIAKAGEIRDVAEGYGRNFLLPRKLAALVSQQTTSRFEAQQRMRLEKQEKMEAELAKVADQIEGKEVIVKAKVGAKNRLYGSITSADITAELENAYGITIDKRRIELEKPIHELGTFDVSIRLAKDVVPKIKVTVSGEVTNSA